MVKYRAMYLRYLLIFFAICLGTFCYSSPTTISNLQSNSTNIGKFEKFEITFSTSTSYSNPYDPEQVDITIYFSSPSSNQLVIPAFWYQGYSPVTGSFENYSAVGSPKWMARIAPTEIGSYSYYIHVTDFNGTSTTGPFFFTCVWSDNKGFLRRNPSNQKYLKFDTGQTYIPLGHDIGWDDHSGTRFFNNYYTKMNQNQENWTRLWLASFQRLALEWCTCHWSGVYPGLGKYSQIPAWRLDYALDLAQQKGIYVQLVLWHHGEFSSSVNAQWQENPYNTTRNGFLSSPDQFFTNSTAKNYARKLLRYIIARWGYNTNVLTWELWNEVQFTDNFGSSTIQQNNVAQWHQEMAQYVRQIDPFQHLITTSSEGDGFQNIWSIPEIDMVQIHYYGSGREQAFYTRTTTYRFYNKPVWFAEFGMGTEGTGEVNDTTGVYLHNGLWAAALSETLAGSWWWDNPIEPYNLYRHFPPLASFLANEDLAAENFSYPNFSISSGTMDTTGLKVYPGLGWDSSRQSDFTIQPDGTAPGVENLASFIQGVWHQEMGRQAIFHFIQLTTGQFGVYISDFSPYGAPILQIFVDNTAVPVYNQTVSTTGLLTVSVSSGNHVIKVYNNGLDWFVANYFQFDGIQLPASEGYGIGNDHQAYFWIHDRGSQPFQNGNGVISGNRLIVNNLQDGFYRVTFYSTYSSAINSVSIQSTVQGTLTVFIPIFQKDIAVKIRYGTTDAELFHDDCFFEK